ncbi:MAG: hypothetical protein PARBA_00198 [Parabacteroides sp.]
MFKEVGVEAGKIWALLAERGMLSIRKIGEVTHFSESLIFMALGWLARENKVRIFEKSGIVHAELNTSVAELYYS